MFQSHPDLHHRCIRDSDTLGGAGISIGGAAPAGTGAVMPSVAATAGAARVGTARPVVAAVG